MKIKINFTAKKVFRYLIALLVAVNFVAVFLTYSFIKKYVYGTILITEEELLSQSTSSGENININKFTTVIEEIKNKKEPRNIKNIKNIFN